MLFGVNDKLAIKVSETVRRQTALLKRMAILRKILAIKCVSKFSSILLKSISDGVFRYPSEFFNVSKREPFLI